MSRASIAAIWNRYGGSTPFPKWQRPAERPYGVEGTGRCRLWGDDIAPLNEEPAGSRQRVFLGDIGGSVSSLTPRVSAIANPLRHDSLFCRHLSNITLVDQRVCAVTPHIDLGLNWCAASTEFLGNITAICLPKVFGFAGSKWCELRFHRGGWVNTAGHFPGD